MNAPRTGTPDGGREPPGTVRLAPVDAANWADVARLRVAEDQANLLSPNVWSLAEAGFEPGHVPRAIVLDDAPVGFCMYCPDDEPGSDVAWLFRFMIAEGHQGKGVGAAALRLVVDEMLATGAARLRTMHKPDNEVAARLYAAAGFVPLGTLDDDGDVELELVRPG